MRQTFIAVSCLFIVAACVTSPTGRKQLVLFPDEQINALGMQSFQRIKKNAPRDDSDVITSYVDCVSHAIIEQLPKPLAKQRWEIVIFKDDTLNAFALPGAKIGIHTAMLRFTQTQDQLAAVIGHEIGHVAARHGNERISQQFAASEIIGLLAGRGDL